MRKRAYFNSRPSARGDTWYWFIPARKGFQFTPLREGRLGDDAPAMRSNYDFNSRPSARGDIPLPLFSGGRIISIHAPPRGATKFNNIALLSVIFQFTPLREGRLQPPRRFPRQSYFNSRPSARGDGAFKACLRLPYISIHAPPRGATAPDCEHNIFHLISIHAPPRGATHCVSPFLTQPAYFNSRPSARGDLAIALAKAQLGTFQFTPLREGRRGKRGAWRRQSDFNSRPSARGDIQRDRIPFRRENFNSRPSARGDGGGLMAWSDFLDISIHAPPRGATELQALYDKRVEISIHAPPRGATARRNGDIAAEIISIHAPPRGATGNS